MRPGHVDMLCGSRMSSVLDRNRSATVQCCGPKMAVEKIAVKWQCMLCVCSLSKQVEEDSNGN